MRFYEYESRRIVELAGIPVTKYGFCTTADEAREAAEEIGGPVVIKSQVLTGGRMKAGGVKFADTPEEAAEHAADDPRARDQRPHAARRARRPEGRGQAGVLRRASSGTGRAKRPLMLFSDMGGIDIEEVADDAPRPRRPRPPLQPAPIPDFEAKQVDRRRPASPARELNRATPILARLARLFRDYDMTLAEINPLAELDRRQLRRPRRPHGDGERGGRRARRRCSASELEIAEDDTRETYEPSEFERNVKAIDAADHRGVIQGKDHGFDGNLGLVIGAGGGSLTLTDAVRSQGGKPANYSEIGGNPSVAKACGLAKEVLEKDGVEKIAVMMSIVSNTRVDIVARGVIKACLELGKDPGETIAIFRIPGAWEEEGFKILDALRGRVLRPLGLDVGGGRPRRREDPGSAGMSILLEQGHHLHRPGDHRARGGQPDPRVPRLRLQGRRRRHPRPQGPRGPRRAGLRHRRAGGRAPRRADRRLGRHRPPRLHQGRGARGDRERDQADRDRHRADPAPRRRPDGRAGRTCAAPGSSAPTASA